MVGVVVGAYGVTQLALRLPVGIAGDRWHARRAIVAGGLVASAAGALLLALAPSPGFLVAGRALAGAAAACWVALLVAAVAAFPAPRMPEAMSAVTVAGTVAEAGAVVAGGILADRVGWRAPFYAAAALAGLGLLPAAHLPGRARRGEAASTYSFVPVVARDLGARQTDVGVLAMLAQGGFAAGALAAGQLARRIAAPRLLALGAGLVAAAAAATPLCRGAAGTRPRPADRRPRARTREPRGGDARDRRRPGRGADDGDGRVPGDLGRRDRRRAAARRLGGRRLGPPGRLPRRGAGVGPRGRPRDPPRAPAGLSA